MNYNPNAGMRNPQGPGRKIKRVSDVNAMGPSMPMPEVSPYMQPTPGPAMLDPMGGGGFGTPPVSAPSTIGGGMGAFNNGSIPMQGQNNMYGNAMPPTSQYQPPYPGSGAGMPNLSASHLGPGGAPPTQGSPYGNAIPPLNMFQQPIVQDMAMQYGQRLADQGKQLVENQFEKWVPVAKLKYYFAVDNRYVINKLRLLFFPFIHKDWAVKYDQEKPVQPRYDVNAPDLYIPTMAYITFVVVAGLMLGMQNRFSPEQLGIQASSALAYSIFELVVYSITLYVVNIKTGIKTLDLLAFSGYKFVTIVACLLVSVFFHGWGYYTALAYCTLSLGFFLLRTLKKKVMNESNEPVSTGTINYDPYGNPQQLDYVGGRKRKLYFLFFIVGGQALFSLLLSRHLYFPDPATLEAMNMKF